MKYTYQYLDKYFSCTIEESKYNMVQNNPDLEI